jgi:curved DNA-binding protein CbpA
VKIDPYRELGVPKDADSGTIKRAYRKASSKAHPDRGGDVMAMTRVNVAYDILSDPARRERFDLGGDDLPPTPPLELRARIQLAQAFQSVLQNPLRLNIVAGAKAFLHENKRKAQGNISGMRYMREHFEKRAADVEFKSVNGEPNIFADQVALSIANLDAQLENTQGTVEAIGRALDMLAAYVSTMKEPQYAAYGGSPLLDLLSATTRRAFPQAHDP